VDRDDLDMRGLDSDTGIPPDRTADQADFITHAFSSSLKDREEPFREMARTSAASQPLQFQEKEEARQ
jgi:hypothetical protein